MKTPHSATCICANMLRVGERARPCSEHGWQGDPPPEQMPQSAPSCACGERKNEGQHAEAVCTVGSAVYLRPEDTDA